MKEKVLNNAVGKLIRTIGFFVIFVSAALLTLIYLKSLNVAAINNQIIPVLDFIERDIPFLFDYLLTFLVGGFILLLWTQSNSYFARIVVTLLALVGVVTHDSISTNNILIIDLEIKFLNDLLVKYDWLTFAIFAGAMLSVYFLLGFKRPKRISTNIISSALFILLIAVVVQMLPEIIGLENWTTGKVYGYILNGLYSLGFITVTVGAAFGTLGFFRS